MSRYIDTDLCKAYATDYYPSVAYGVKKIIDEQPTADVKPVASGEWVDTTHGLKCSACDTFQVYGSRYFKYCPICGAEMGVEE